MADSRFMPAGRVLAWLLLMGCALPLQAAELVLNGIAEYWKLRSPYYLGALYLEQREDDADVILALQAEKRMDIHIIVDKWRPRSFSQMWMVAAAINNTDITIKAARELETLEQIFKDDLLKGDMLSYSYQPGVGTSIALNGELMLQTEDEELFNNLLQVWIGKIPPSTNFRADILSMPPPDQAADLIGLAQTLKPTSARRQLTGRWREASTPETEVAVSREPVPVVQSPALPAGKNKDAASPDSKPADRVAPVANKVAVAAEQSAAVAAKAAKPADAGAAAAPRHGESQQPIAKPEPKPQSLPAVASKVAAGGERGFATASEPAAVAPSIDERRKTALFGYKAEVRKIVNEAAVFPERALRMRQEGVVTLELELSNSGKLLRAELAKRSIYPGLNKAAIQAAQAVEYGAIPEILELDTIQVLVPVNFFIP